MTANTTIRAWKDSKFRASLAAAPANPAGARLTEIDEAQLQNVGGASPGIGNFWTISYECQGFRCDFWNTLAPSVE